MLSPDEFILKTADRLLLHRDRVFIAIDGRCAAGKTTLAASLGQDRKCSVIHMDDFFLRPQQRTAERLREPGGNVDYERLLEEVMLPLSRNQDACYRPYDCKSQAFRDAVCVKPGALTVVEGAYSCHPRLWDFYDLRVFLNVEAEEQLRRIRERNGAAWAVDFQEKWIPLEEKYFKAYSIEKRCELIFRLHGGSAEDTLQAGFKA